MEPSRPDLRPVSQFTAQAPIPPVSRRMGAPTPPEHHESVVDTAWRTFRRHKWLILQAIVICAAAAYAYSTTRPDQYTATASILFRSATEDVLGTNRGFVDPSREAATNEKLLSLGVVAERTERALDGRVSAAEIAAAVEIQSEPEADIVNVDVTTEDPEQSARIANAYGTAFIAFRRESARERIGAAIELAQSALDALSPEAAAGEDGRLLRERLNELQSAVSLQTGDAELVQQATAPTVPSAPQPRRNGILGGILGLIIGFLLATVRERWNQVVREPDELEEVFGRPVLASIPRSSRLGSDNALPPRSAEAEAFRMLRAALRYASVNEPLASLLVVSARPGEGKSTVAWRLAETMSAMGDRVVLVDADMHHTSKADRQRADVAGGGLSGVLIGEPLLESLHQVTVEDSDDTRTFAYLPSGGLPPNPSELLESQGMSDVMDELEADFDIVILDSPPLPILSDALPLVHRVSGVIAVCALGRSKRDAIRALPRLVASSGGNLLGVVANMAPPASREALHYYSER
jgi:polysaccharide biosynthesis transport protein